MAKFWCYTFISLERESYEYLDINQRIWTMFNYGIETEDNVLRRCPAYIGYRNDWSTAANNVNYHFNTFNDCDKMCFTLNEPKWCRLSAKPATTTTIIEVF